MTVQTNQALVGTEETAAGLGEPGPRILEVDEDTEAYGHGHIPGALSVHWKLDLQDPVRREFIGADAFAALMDRLGIGNDTEVVLYGGNNWFAAYAYWYFKFYGHEAVRLIDGGRNKWELEGRPMTTEVRPVAAGSGYQVKGPVTEIRALRDLVGRVIGEPGFGLVDVRSPEEYRGETLAPPHLPQEQAQRGGHVPGAAQHPVGQGGRPADRGVPARGAAPQPLRGPGAHRGPRAHRLLPHRRAQRAQLVRPARAARLPEGPQLRRLLDRVGVDGRRPHRAVGGAGARGPSGAASPGLLPPERSQ